MGKRTRDEVIYSRVDYRVKQEFESRMKESGYKTSADFIDYLLRVNKGRQIDGTTNEINQRAMAGRKAVQMQEAEQAVENAAEMGDMKEEQNGTIMQGM